ncbi:uncharacterized protein UHOD_11693 [Ustilago sp. UG-2017b]|nr:uncharacterized protein UHOD_11693 [Ustilago sp. UG-2017b]
MPSSIASASTPDLPSGNNDNNSRDPPNQRSRPLSSSIDPILPLHPSASFAFPPSAVVQSIHRPHPALVSLPPAPATRLYTDQLKQLHEYVRGKLDKANSQSADQFDRHRLPSPHFQPGDRVWLSADNIRSLRPTKKLDYRRLGPFSISEVISSHAFRLQLPPSMKIHNVFHVERFEPRFHIPSSPNKLSYNLPSWLPLTSSPSLASANNIPQAQHKLPDSHSNSAETHFLTGVNPPTNDNASTQLQPFLKNTTTTSSKPISL